MIVNGHKKCRTSGFLTRFRRDESGVATIFACFIIMMMVLVGGIGVDLMHNEMERTRLQNTLDRAVLAAADLDQPLKPSEVVADYFAKSGFPGQPGTVTVDQGLNYRIVTASAKTQHDTQFMRLMGVERLSVPATGTAEERITKVEISVVLDISGSMRLNSRIDNLRDAANTFVDQLITADTQDLISLSIIPYSQHVNVGPDIFQALPNYNQRHDYSYCVEIPATDYQSAGISATHVYDQGQFFQWYDSGWTNVVDVTTCPRHSFEQIQPMSQDAPALRAQINKFQPRAQTAIFLGMKWAAALLDPSTRPMIAKLIKNGKVDAAFAGRPADYSDKETLKTIVVMTDGRNTTSMRIQDWAYDSVAEYEHWKKYNFWWYLNRYVRYSSRSKYYETHYTDAQGDVYTDQICSAAKAQGIIVWGVGFEVDDHGASVLKKCASSPSHFFRVEGTEISEAFSAIATQINQLRLTQ